MFVDMCDKDLKPSKSAYEHLHMTQKTKLIYQGLLTSGCLTKANSLMVCSASEQTDFTFYQSMDLISKSCIWKEWAIKDYVICRKLKIL